MHESTGRPVTIPTRKARALFVLLACCPDKRWTREVLASFFWPDKSDSQARCNLRQALKIVRRAFGEGYQDIFVTEGEALGLQFESINIDCVTFERLRQSGLPEAFEQAAKLYLGDFLEGLNLADGAFEEWSAQERVRFREQAITVFTSVLEQSVEANKLDVAIEMALRLLALDPWQEQIYFRLMELYISQGRRGAALEQYRTCRNVLEKDLGVAPGPEIERLYMQISRERHCSVTVDPMGRQSSIQADHRTAGEATPITTVPAVAVLPFNHFRGDLVQPYFRDGLCEDITSALAGWRCFPVIAINSTLNSCGGQQDMKSIARGLGAQYLASGSIRREGNRMIINARLVKGDTGQHLWSQRFKFDLRDIMSVQEEAAQRIAATIQPELERAEVHRIISRRTNNLTAWECCLKGLFHLHKRTKAGNALARADFKLALTLDPEYSDAYTGLAFAYLRDLHDLPKSKRHVLIDKGLSAARQAITLDSESSMAHLAFATAHVWTERFGVALPATQLAIDLNPSNAVARMALGNRLDLIGRTEEGIAQMQNAIQLNPRDPERASFMGFLARANVALKQYENARKWAHKAVQCRPDQPDLHFRLAVCLGHLDRYEEAASSLRDCEHLRPGFLKMRWKWKPYDDASRNDEFFAGLTRCGLFGKVDL